MLAFRVLICSEKASDRNRWFQGLKKNALKGVGLGFCGSTEGGLAQPEILSIIYLVKS